MAAEDLKEQGLFASTIVSEHDDIKAIMKLWQCLDESTVLDEGSDEIVPMLDTIVNLFHNDANNLFDDISVAEEDIICEILHNQLLLVNGEKESKGLSAIVDIEDIQAKAELWQNRYEMIINVLKKMDEYLGKNKESPQNLKNAIQEVRAFKLELRKIAKRANDFISDVQKIIDTDKTAQASFKNILVVDRLFAFICNCTKFALKKTNTIEKLFMHIVAQYNIEFKGYADKINKKDQQLMDYQYIGENLERIKLKNFMSILADLNIIMSRVDLHVSLMQELEQYSTESEKPDCQALFERLLLFREVILNLKGNVEQWQEKFANTKTACLDQIAKQVAELAQLNEASFLPS